MNDGMRELVESASANGIRVCGSCWMFRLCSTGVEPVAALQQAACWEAPGSPEAERTRRRFESCEIGRKEMMLLDEMESEATDG